MLAAAEFSWDALLNAVRAEYPDLYRAWFESLPPPTLHAGELRFLVNDPAKARFLRDSCSTAFLQAAMTLTGHLISVRFIYPGEGQAGPVASSPAAPFTQSALSPDYVFEQFVVGPSNRLAHAACRAVCAHPGSVYNPLFIHGRSGLGKTHLLQASCAELLAHHRPGEILYLSCEAFTNHLIRAIETGRLTSLRESIRRLDALIIDDVQFLANRESTQEELFHTFNALYQAGKQIILSADCPPSQIPSLEDRLVTRFNWGLVTQIDPPNRETRQAILHKKASLRACQIPNALLDLLAERVASNVRLLEGALTRFISETQIGGKPMNLDTVREVLDNLEARPQRPLQIRDILEAVSAHFGVRPADLLGRKRSRSISYPRQISMYLARKLTPLSLEEVGAYFGRRHHSTVLHAQRVIDSSRRTNKDTAATLAHLTNQLLTPH